MPVFLHYPDFTLKSFYCFYLDHIMKRRFCCLTLIVLVLMLFSCTKQSLNRSGNLLLTGTQGSKGFEIVCIDLDSGVVVNSTPIDCYVFGSTVYDPGSGGYGYVGCDSVFKLVNPETGKLLKSIKLPGYVSQCVIDTKDNMLIGRYTVTTYEDDPDTVETKSVKEGPPIYTNYVIRVDLETGTIVSHNKVDIGDGVYACSYYYNQEEKGYVLYRADQYLITVNPSTGVVMKEVYVGRILHDPVFNPDNKTVICMSYSTESERNFVEIIDTETGSVISSKMVDKEVGYHACISGFDSETNCYITVNAAYEVLFYEISTGEIKKSYNLDAPMNDIKFWRK